MGHIANSTALTPPDRVSFEEEMRTSYRDYAMSVIVSRALPDVRDGLKPVHRRILYGMFDGGFRSDKPFKKSARVVGDVMGKLHPHGDSSIYEAMVRMAQYWSMGIMLIHGQGNFGSVDGDNAAAMRYTEAKMARVSDEGMVADIEEDTVDFHATYDNVGKEPDVLPARFANILVNGGEGIAVGMATRIAPHNLGEIIDATLALMDDPDVDLETVTRLAPGPDFPTGGVILGRSGIRDAYANGKGSIVLSSVHEIETDKSGRRSIVITELPFQVNKALLLERIADLTREKDPKKPSIEGIADLRDESTAQIRVVIVLKKDANADLVLNQLRKHTNFVIRFNVNATCLNSRGEPQVMGILEMLTEFVAFRRETVARRTRFRLEKARDRLITQIGFFAARSRVDHVVSLIRGAESAEAARASLMAIEFACEGELAELLMQVDPDADPESVFRLSEEQATSILALRLSSLTRLKQDEIAAEARDLKKAMDGLIGILGDTTLLDAVIRQEMVELKAKYPLPRRTRIENAGPSEIEDDDLIEDKQVVLSLTKQGYVKITDLASYREQSRGGKGKTGMDTKDDDFVTGNLVCSTRTNLIFFTTRGIAHTVKAYKLPTAAANAKGRPIINFLGGTLHEGETIATMMAMPHPDEAEGRFMVFVTDEGDVRRNAVSDFSRVQASGKIAMKLADDNGHQTSRLISVLECGEGDDLVLATRRGKASRFPVEEIRVFKSRDSTGNKGISLLADDSVIGACIVGHFEASAQERDAFFNEGSSTWKDDEGVERSLVLSPARYAEMRTAEQTLLTVTSLGFGKRFSTHDFRVTGRGAQGVWAGSFGAATGDLVALCPVQDADGIMLVTNGGQAIRTRCSEIRVMGRSTRGVRLFDLPGDQMIVDVARVSSDD